MALDALLDTPDADVVLVDEVVDGSVDALAHRAVVEPAAGQLHPDRVDEPRTGDVPLRALRAVAAVASAGSVAQAAQELHQSTAAITRAVQGAERALGLKLFERGPRGMAPTAAGAILAQRVSRALQALQQAAHGLQARGAAASVIALPRLVNDTLLQALVARAAHCSEASAAAAVGLSQPALHQALTRLEHTAKTALFERTRLGSRLNESGEWLLQQVKLALAEIRVGHEELARLRGHDESQVSIGTLPMASDVLVSQLVAQVLGRRPQLRITVKDGTYAALTRLLRSAEIDLLVGPLRGDSLSTDFCEERLYVDRFVAVARSGHPLLAAGADSTLRDIAAYPSICPLPDTPAHAVVARLFAESGLACPTAGLQAHNTTILRSVLLASDHVALMSPLQVHAEVQAGLLAHVSAPLRGSERPIGITLRRDAAPSSACAEVLSTLRTVAAAAQAILPR